MLRKAVQIARYPRSGFSDTWHLSENNIFIDEPPRNSPSPSASASRTARRRCRSATTTPDKLSRQTQRSPRTTTTPVRLPSMVTNNTKSFILDLPDELLLHIFKIISNIASGKNDLLSLSLTSRRFDPLAAEVLFATCRIVPEGRRYGPKHQPRRIAHRLDRWLGAVERRPELGAFVKTLDLVKVPVSLRELGRLPGALERCTTMTTLHLDWPFHVCGVELLEAMPPTLAFLRLLQAPLEPYICPNCAIRHIDGGQPLKMSASPQTLMLSFRSGSYSYHDGGKSSLYNDCDESSFWLHGPFLRHCAGTLRLQQLEICSLPDELSSETLLEVFDRARSSLTGVRLEFVPRLPSPPRQLDLLSFSTLTSLERLCLEECQVNVSREILSALPPTLKTLALTECFGIDDPDAFLLFITARAGTLETLRLHLRERSGRGWEEVRRDMRRYGIEGIVSGLPRVSRIEGLGPIIAALADLSTGPDSAEEGRLDL